MRARRTMMFLLTALPAVVLPTVPGVARAGDDAATTGTPAASPMLVDVYVRGERRDQKVAGKLIAHDEQKIVVDVQGTGPRELAWDALTPSSAFTLRSRLIDKSSAADWLALGTWGWLRGLEPQAKTALAQARRLDAALGTSIDGVLATKSGTYKPPAVVAAGPATRPAAGELIGDAAATGGAMAGNPTTQSAGVEEVTDNTTMQPGFDRAQKIIVYAPPTPAEVQASLDASRKEAAKTRQKLKVELAEVETPHFLIYTDWDPREYGFLKDQCEGAYRAVSKQFALPATGNVFVGKLPIYMFKNQSDFQAFAKKLDAFTAPATVLGYFSPTEQMGHMAMWKPGIGTGIGSGGGSLEKAQRNWARTLIHEFCHAFVHRYKSNARIPRWLNEGTAELISEGELPTNNYRATARLAAVQNVDVAPLFDDDNMPGGFYYPAMMTMAECLAKQDPKAFIALYNDIKEGVDPEEALQNRFNVDYAKFAEKWRTYAKALR